jgi:hypothetical protein
MSPRPPNGAPTCARCPITVLTPTPALPRERGDTELPALANEDDHLELTSKLHGAVTVHAAMDVHSRARSTEKTC